MSIKGFYVWLMIFFLVNVKQCVNPRTHPTAKSKRSHESIEDNKQSIKSIYSSNHNISNNTPISITVSHNISYCKCNIKIGYNDNITTETEVKRNTCYMLLPTINKDSVESISCHVFSLDSPDTKISMYRIQNTKILNSKGQDVILPKYAIWIIAATIFILTILLIGQQFLKSKNFIYPTKQLVGNIDDTDDVSHAAHFFKDRAMMITPQVTGSQKINSSFLYEPKIDFDRDSIEFTFRRSLKNASTYSNVSNGSDAGLKTPPITPEEIDIIVQRVLSENTNSPYNEFTDSNTHHIQIKAQNFP